MKGTGEPVLYLDYDGVLHHENVWLHPLKGPYLKAPQGYKLFQHVDLLEEALEPYPRIKIVLSTSWVRVRHYSRALKCLSPSLQSRTIGATFHSQMNEDAFEKRPRGEQVILDVQRRQPSSWLAIDDVDEGWGNWRENLVLTHEHEGISDPDVLALLKRKLAAMATG